MQIQFHLRANSRNSKVYTKKAEDTVADRNQIIGASARKSLRSEKIRETSAAVCVFADPGKPADGELTACPSHRGGNGWKPTLPFQQ